MLQDSITITYQEAEQTNEQTLRRLLVWSLRNDPARERIMRESSSNKQEILRALCWVGVIQ